LQIKHALASDPQNEKLLSLQKGTLERMEVVKNIKPMMEKASALMREGKHADARDAFAKVTEVDPFNNEAFARLSELFLINSRTVALAEIEQVNKMAEEASGQKRWFDAALLWSMVREIHPDNQKALDKLSEAGTQLKLTGLPGLAAHTQDPWAPSVKSSYEKGIGFLLNGNAGAAAGEWRQTAQKVPECASMFEPVMSRIKDLNTYHASYHADRAKSLFERKETGRAMWHVKHGLQVDPQSAELRAIYEANAANAEKVVVDRLTEAENLLAGDHLRQAMFSLERAFDIDPGREGLKQKIADLKARIDKTGQIFAAMDKVAGGK
jgi:tetratricopeptide (TPR) repeat protein